MKLKYAIWVIVILLLPVASASMQKPNWGVGNHWEYEGSYMTTYKVSVENITYGYEAKMNLNVYLSVNIIDVSLEKMKNRMYGCYVAKVDSRIVTDPYKSNEIRIQGIQWGGKSYTIPIQLHLNVTASGKIYLSTDNLSIVKSHLHTHVVAKATVKASGIPQELLEKLGYGYNIDIKNDTIAEYDPPLDFMNFPVENGEKWWTNSTVEYTIDNKKSDPTPVSFSFSCDNAVENLAMISSDYLPFLGETAFKIGDFDMPIPLSFGEIKFVWSKDIGMIQTMAMQKSVSENYTQMTDKFDLKLQPGYSYTPTENLKPVIEEINATPFEPSVDEMIKFSSYVTDDGSIVSWYWQFGDGSNSTKANPSHIYSKPGKYKVKLTVMDNYGATSTKEMEIEIGSDGEGGGGGGTPGFEIVFLIIAIAIILLRKSSIFK